MVSYEDSIKFLDAFFERYGNGAGYAVLTGETKIKHREFIVSKFNDPDLELRVLISNMKVCSKGISLHDTDGRFPRVIYAIPNYSFETVHQAACRIGRVGEKSKSRVRFIYGKNSGSMEISILDALNQKSKNMEKIVGSEEIFYPSKYESFYEN